MTVEEIQKRNWTANNPSGGLAGTGERGALIAQKYGPESYLNFLTGNREGTLRDELTGGIEDYYSNIYGKVSGGKTKEDYMSDLLRSIGTQMTQSRNVLSEQNILSNASASTQRATQMGLAYQGALAAEQGEQNVENLMQQMREQALTQALNASFKESGMGFQERQAALDAMFTQRNIAAQKKAAEDQASASFWSGIGQGAGTLIGGIL